MAGVVIVVSGPGGVGKGTVVSELVRRDPRLSLSRSWTTRIQRPGESDDAYVFVTDEEFRSAIEAGRFLEWDHHFGAYYGSPVPDDAVVDDLLLEIDVNGARQIHNGDHDAMFLFIDTPSVDVQRARMIGRGDSLDKVEERLAAGQLERELAADLPYLYVENIDVQECAAEVGELIEDYRRLQTN